MNEAWARRLVRERATPRFSMEPLCELCYRRPAINFHHRKNHGQGGRWCPANGLALCGSGTTGCHGRVTSLRTLARVNGWSVHPEGTPAIEPVQLFRGWVLLHPDGGLTPVVPQTVN